MGKILLQHLEYTRSHVYENCAYVFVCNLKICFMRVETMVNGLPLSSLFVHESGVRLDTDRVPRLGAVVESVRIGNE